MAKGGYLMREIFSGSLITVAIAGAALSAGISVSTAQTSAQAPTTAWGEPDLQGVWMDETDTPLQRPAKYATQEFFTAAQRAELDDARTAVLVNADAGVHAERRGTA